MPIARLLDSSSKRSVIASGASAAIFTSALASEVGSEEELRRLQGIFGFLMHILQLLSRNYKSGSRMWPFKFIGRLVSPVS